MVRCVPSGRFFLATTYIIWPEIATCLFVQSRSCQGMLQRSAANNDQAAKVDNEARKNFDQAPSAHLGCCMFGCIKTIQIAYGLMIGSHGEGERNSGSAQLSAKSRAGLCDKLGALRV